MRSVRENIAAFDAIDGEHVEAGGREVVAVIDQVPIGAQWRPSGPGSITYLPLKGFDILPWHYCIFM